MKKAVKEQYEFENKVLSKILPMFESANVWGKDGFQIQISQILRETIKETLKENSNTTTN